MGIFRPNLFLIEEFSSPGDPRFRVEMDVRIHRSEWDALEAALQEGPMGYPRVRTILLQKLAALTDPPADPRAAPILWAALPGSLEERRSS